MISIEIPGKGGIIVENLVMDFNGTLAVDGRLIEGVSERLRRLSGDLNLFILTADTFGLVEESCAGLPVAVNKLSRGNEAEQKQVFVRSLLVEKTAAIGNGANDYLMLSDACFSIVVLGGEGMCAKVFTVSDIIVPDIRTGLDLFLNPKRIIATLRE